MENFTFYNKTKIIFGKNTEKQIGKETACYTKKVLLHYGGKSIKQTGLYNTIIQSLKEFNIEIVELSGVVPNPRLSLVYEGIRLVREEKIDFILAVGGGSVIDSAKAIAVGATYEGDVWDFYTGNAIAESAIALGVVLTIPAAGSEASTGSVITKEEGELKRAYNSLLLRPEFAILNPELTFTLPNNQTSNGVSDMMAHIFERYFTNSKNVELIDRLSESTLKTIINNVHIALTDNNDYASRAEILWAGTLAHNGLLGTGRVEDWSSHMIEHELSGIYDIPHGAGLSVIFPAWMKYVYKHDLARFAQFAERVFDVQPINDIEKMALAGIAKLELFYKSIDLPTKLSEVAIGEDRFKEMAEKATERGPVGSFVKLKADDVFAILQLAK